MTRFVISITMALFIYHKNHPVFYSSPSGHWLFSYHFLMHTGLWEPLSLMCCTALHPSFLYPLKGQVVMIRVLWIFCLKGELNLHCKYIVVNTSTSAVVCSGKTGRMDCFTIGSYDGTGLYERQKPSRFSFLNPFHLLYTQHLIHWS